MQLYPRHSTDMPDSDKALTRRRSMICSSQYMNRLQLDDSSGACNRDHCNTVLSLGLLIYNQAGCGKLEHDVCAGQQFLDQ